TVGAMDGAIEPPGMGLRRVLHAPPTRSAIHRAGRRQEQNQNQKRVARCARSLPFLFFFPRYSHRF
ncbi:hypothetical protein, partial [Stenotrophomonas maltophilia]|uniref:hypothetical protein n=1 Tax=Stenotrophomonas maltophilia TaxID=40324 RepID=UPI003A8690F0